MHRDDERRRLLRVGHVSAPGGSSGDDKITTAEFAGAGVGCAFGLVTTILLGLTLSLWTQRRLEAISLLDTLSDYGLGGDLAEPSYGPTIGTGLCFVFSSVITLGGLGLLYKRPHGALAVLGSVGLTMCLGLALVTFDAVDHYEVFSEVHPWDAATDAMRADVYSQLSAISGSLLGACCCLGVLPSLIGAGIIFQRRRSAPS